ncbi:MAG: hypothetical protein JJU28_22800 [Cyclobacteriaceae bacterium]|nr:hypothetical protein [Cyclobacteriaceae bacterium]
MTEAGDGAHEELLLEVVSQTEGYMYIYTVPNSNGIRERFDPVWENGIDDITMHRAGRPSPRPTHRYWQSMTTIPLVWHGTTQ